MRSILALALLAVPLGAAAQPAPRHGGEKACSNPAPRNAEDAGHVARFRRLGDLPPADETLALLRTEDGCSKPVTIRYGIGARTPDAFGEPGR